MTRVYQVDIESSIGGLSTKMANSKQQKKKRKVILIRDNKNRVNK